MKTQNKNQEEIFEKVVNKIQDYIMDWEFVKHTSEFTFKRIKKLIEKIK